jgi:hypothetical protein
MQVSRANRRLNGRSEFRTTSLKRQRSTFATGSGYYCRLPHRDEAPRRGVILLVVLALLTLFAIVGISFVFYADAAAASSRIFREAESDDRPDVDPERLFTYFLGQLVYDVPDDETGIYSCLRGHSLARNMYGLNYNKSPGSPIQYDDQNQLPINQVPFNGTGRLHTRLPVAGAEAPGSYNNPFKLDDYNLINYTYFKRDGFLRDPERFGALVVQGTGTLYRPYRTDPTSDKELPGYYVGGFNPPYTYPDLNNMYLATVKAGTGEPPSPLGPVSAGTVLAPSFHRSWLFGSLTERRNNPNWTNREGKYQILRPRPIDQKHRPDDPDEPELFPYPEDEGGDVKNLIGSPGLLYLDHGKPQLASNDSLWLDLDFPVMAGKDGRKFKALFAPLILDLDNRINLNVHGNLRGTGRADHASNQGWGAWEVNVGRVLNASPPEWQGLFQTSTGQTGRYGRDNHPHSPLPPLTASSLPPLYAPVDFDGSDQNNNGAPSGPLMLAPKPGPMAVPYQCFPDPPAGYSYGNRFEAERIDHPSLYNPLTPAIPDRAYPLSNLEALLRFGDTGSPALTSELFHICPQNFGDVSDPTATARRRGLVTLRSFDLDRPGITPWFWADVHGAGYNRWPPLTPTGSLHPCGGPIASPPFPPTFEPDPDSDFGPDWRASARLSSLRRLDLNRHLPDYPMPNSNGVIEDLVQFAVAQRARQYLAAEIFEILWRVTGTGNPADIVAPPVSASDPLYPRWNAMRALAQLAVNIVDFIDSDDYMTPFVWHPQSGAGVFGTELPRLVLNEAFVQYVNDPRDTRLPPSFSNVNVWVELLNPLLSSDLPLMNPTALSVDQVNLVNGDYSVYQLALCKNASLLRQVDNVTGEQPCLKTPAGRDAVVRFTERRVIPPVSKNYKGPGFLVVGPQYNFGPDEDPRLPADLLTPEMTALVNSTGIAPITILLRRLACPHLPPNDPKQPNYNPVLPFNPYITVDYMEDVPANDVLGFSTAGPRDGGPPALPDRASYGRKQPYAGHKSMLVRQAPEPTQRSLQACHTLGRHNGVEAQNPDPKRPGQTLKLPFDWLVHLDRRLVSPMELLHVSAFKPHELTQEFMNPSGRFHHRAPWFDEDLPAPNSADPLSHRLYRALEFLGTHNQTVGMTPVSVKSLPPPFLPPLPPQGPAQGQRAYFAAPRFGATPSGGTWEINEGSSLILDQGKPNEEVVRVNAILARMPPDKAFFEAEFIRRHEEPFTITPTTISERIPGKININTIWDPEIWMALCDPQPSNAFTETQIAHLFKSLLQRRSKHGQPSKDDRPFRSVATGFYPAKDEIQFPGSDIDDTVLQAKVGSPNRQRLFQVPVSPPHPYLQYQLLNKIFNNITVRSNVFAVWITVGFFEVTDDAGRPVKLGAELGRAENRQIRHRMFAIVDRSCLQNNPGPQPQFDPRAAPSPGSSTGMVVPYFSIIE